MKIVVSSTGDSLDSQIDPRFGRCKFFLIIETDDMSFEYFNNESIALGGGAGIQSAGFVASKEVKAVLTGNCGPKALEVFTKANVEVFTDFAGTVKDAVKRFKNGGQKPIKKATVAEKAGVGTGSSDTLVQGDIQSQSFGQGMDGGGGRGIGGGGRCMGGSGRGMGMGGGRGMCLGSGSNFRAPIAESNISVQDQPKETITVHANIEVTIESLQAIVSNAKIIADQNGEDPALVDTADRVSEIISHFLNEKDFETFTTNIVNYQ
jgi:predicted Fe-Mo cluster-binding NifX family protein